MRSKPYPSDVSDEQWAFVLSYLSLLQADVPQRKHELREVFNGLRWLVRARAPWRYLPSDLPPWEIVYQQTRRWLKAGVFETMAHDLRALIRQLGGREPAPSAAIVDPRTLSSICESGSNCESGSPVKAFRAVKAVRGPDTTAPKSVRGARFTSPWTPWAIFWLSI